MIFRPQVYAVETFMNERWLRSIVISTERALWKACEARVSGRND